MWTFSHVKKIENNLDYVYLSPSVHIMYVYLRPTMSTFMIRVVLITVSLKSPYLWLP